MPCILVGAELLKLKCPLLIFWPGHQEVFLHLGWCWLWDCCKSPLLCYAICLISLISPWQMLKRYRISSKACSASIKMIMWLLSFTLFICRVTFTDLCMLNHPCVLWNEAYLIMLNDNFNMFLYLVEKFHMGNFCIFVHRGALGLCLVFISCRYQFNCGFLKEIGQHSFYYYFIK